MKKISALFARDPNNPRILTDAYHPDAAWVVAGEGVATRKWNGTAVLVRGGRLFVRYDAKHGKIAPSGFEPAQDPDPITGHHPGWLPAERPEDKWVRAAAEASGMLEDGTYEACGPKIGGNPERLTDHWLYRHGNLVLWDVPRDKAGLMAYFSANDIEGIVWWRRRGDDTCEKIKITGAALGVQRPNHEHHPWQGSPVTSARPSAPMGSRQQVFIVVRRDRHFDLGLSVHLTRESADAAIAKFQSAYAEDDYIWVEESCGSPRWERYVGTGGGDGPSAYIEISEVVE